MITRAIFINTSITESATVHVKLAAHTLWCELVRTNPVSHSGSTPVARDAGGWDLTIGPGRIFGFASLDHATIAVPTPAIIKTFETTDLKQHVKASENPWPTPPQTQVPAGFAGMTLDEFNERLTGFLTDAVLQLQTARSPAQ